MGRTGRVHPPGHTPGPARAHACVFTRRNLRKSIAAAEQENIINVIEAKTEQEFSAEQWHVIKSEQLRTAFNGRLKAGLKQLGVPISVAQSDSKVLQENLFGFCSVRFVRFRKKVSCHKVDMEQV